MDVRRLQILLFVVSSALTGSAVSAAGSIGFVGLVTPHLVRLALGSDNRVVLPASALLGGVLLMAADLAARVLIAPRQLPVGRPHGAGGRAAVPGADVPAASVTGSSGGNVTTWSVARRTPMCSPMRWSWWLGTSDSTRRPLGNSRV